MAHFAQLDENNKVIQVIVVHNNELLVDGIELEAKGIEFCQTLFGGTWIQTSYNNTMRKNYAGVNFVYDRTRDAFIPPQPYASWTLNEITCLWNAPTPMPIDDKQYTWNEETTAWVEAT